MQLKGTEESIHAGRPTRFRVRLDAEDGDGGIYTFTTDPPDATLDGVLGTLNLRRSRATS